MPRLPPGWHLSAGSWFGRPPAAQGRLPATVPGHEFYERHQVPLRQTGQSVVAANGTAAVVAFPDGVGSRWYVSQVQVATTSGPADSSQATVYAGAVVPHNVIGATDQGGGDTIGVSVPPMVPGDLLTAVWAGANPGDRVTLIVYGDQEVLM